MAIKITPEMINAAKNQAKELRSIISLLNRWVNKYPNHRAYMVRMWHEDENGVFVEDDNGGLPHLLDNMIESFLFDESDTLHERTKKQMQLGPIEKRNQHE